MKNLWLIAFLFNGVLTLLYPLEKETQRENKYFLYKDLKINLYLSQAFENQNTKTDFPLWGMKFSVPGVEGIFYEKEEAFSYGLSVNLKNFYSFIPITVKFGTLSISGNQAKLNSPCLSNSITAFSNATVSVSPTYGNLAGSGGFSKPFSIYLKYELPFKNKKNKTEINGVFIFPEEEFSSLHKYTMAVTGYGKYNVGKKTQLSFASTFGLFAFPEIYTSSWFSTSFMNNFYHSDNNLCFNNQLKLYKNNYNGIFIISGYQQPTGKMAFTFRQENLIKFNKTNLNFSGFYSPENLFTSSQKKVENQLQIKTGIQQNNIFLIKQSFPIFTRIGFNFYLLKDSENNYIFKSAAGFRFSTSQITETISGDVAYKFSQTSTSFSDSLDSFGFQLKTSLSNIKITPNISGNFSFAPTENQNWKTSEKFSVSLNCPDKFSTSAGFTFKQTDGEKTGNQFSISITGKYNLRNLNITGKINGTMEF